MKPAEDQLKALAYHFNVTGLGAAHIAIQKLYLELFYEESEFEFPSEEQFKTYQDVSKNFITTDDIGRSKALAMLAGKKNKLELEMIEVFIRHLNTFDVGLFNEGTLTGLLSAWLICGAISKETWEALNELKADRLNAFAEAQINKVAGR